MLLRKIDIIISFQHRSRVNNFYPPRLAVQLYDLSVILPFVRSVGDQDNSRSR